MDNKTFTFKGIINDKTFDNFEDFNNYLREHVNEINTIRYDYVTQGLQKDDEQPEQPVEESRVETKEIKDVKKYFPVVDPDTFVEKYDVPQHGLDDVAAGYNDLLTEYLQDIVDMSEEQLFEQLNLLNDMITKQTAIMDTNKEAYKSAVNKLSCIEEEIDKTKNKIKGLEQHLHDMEDAYGKKSDSAEFLKIADSLFVFRKDAIWKARRAIDERLKVLNNPDGLTKKKTVEDQKKNKTNPYYTPLQKLIEEMFKLVD